MLLLRFSKRKIDLPAGRVVQGVFTRDYRHNTLNCQVALSHKYKQLYIYQILVTVPECLEILLLSPERLSWSKNLRYVIFDEVDSPALHWSLFGTQIYRCTILAQRVAEKCGSISSPSYAAPFLPSLPLSRIQKPFMAG